MNVASGFSFGRRFKPLQTFAVITSLILALPIIVIIYHLFSGSGDLWQHLLDSVLADYIFNSLLLMLGVSVGVLLLGVPTAWLTSVCEFPGRHFFSWSLLLPLAFPAYIIAYTYTGMLDAYGVIQSTLRELTGWQYGDYWFFNIRSLPGAITMLSLVLYPYVYLLARTAFLDQSANILEAGRILGRSRYGMFATVILPMARPAIIAGLTLALMETLADFGTVQYFGISAFTTGIFRTFYGYGDIAGAAQLSSVLLLFVVVVILMEKYSRRKIRYHESKGKKPKKIRLRGRKAIFAWIICLTPLLFGFIIPSAQLLYWALFESVIDNDFLELAWNSLYLAAMAALVALILAVILAYAKRLSKKVVTNVAVTFSSLGYALPGTIIAIGIIIPFSWLDQQLILLGQKHFNWDLGLVLSGSLFILLFAYTVRFLAVSLGAVDSSLQKVRPNLDSAARLLGHRPLSVLMNVHIPLVSGSLLTAFLIVFVDVLKELPATLILRPFNFNTLAVKAYELASDERLIDAAPASLLIVLVGLVPVILLSRSITLSNTPHKH